MAPLPRPAHSLECAVVSHLYAELSAARKVLREQGWSVDHTSLFRWVQRYGPELAARCRAFLKPTNKSYRVDETYIKVKGKDRYLYRAVDSTGQTIDFLLTAKRDAAGAKRFFRKAFQSPVNASPRVVNVDKNPAHPVAIETPKAEGVLSPPGSPPPVQVPE